MLIKVESFLEDTVIGECLVISSPENLLKADRLDIAAKLLYIEGRAFDITFYKKVYEEHIRIITLGDFSEFGNPEKNSLENFIISFENIINSINSIGFDSSYSVIPLSITGSVANGAHRLATCIYFKKQPLVVQTSSESQYFDYFFFKNRGLRSNFLNSIVRGFLTHSVNSYVAVIWPASSVELDDVIPYFKDLVGVNSLNLNHGAIQLIVSELYRDTEWIKNEKNYYTGAYEKAYYCSNENNSTHIIAFTANDLDMVLDLKNKFRDSCKIGKHSIHITDNKQESINAGKFLFNTNLNEYNIIKPYKNLEFQKSIFKILNIFSDYNINPENIVFDGGIVLDLYGLRKHSDIDFICLNLSDSTLEILKTNNINCHNDEFKFLEIDFQKYIFDDTYYLIFRGLKFLKLEYVIDFKKRRGEKKDLIDIQLSNILYSNKKNYINEITLIWKSKLLFYKHKIINSIIKSLIKLNLFNITKKIIRFFFPK
jgi:hypothetical protein